MNECREHEQQDATQNPPDADLTGEVIERLARAIVNRRLETPAVFFIEMNRPLSFLMGQSVMLASPLFAPLFGIEKVETFSALLSDRRNVDRLMNRIEDLYCERQQQGMNTNASQSHGISD